MDIQKFKMRRERAKPERAPTRPTPPPYMMQLDSDKSVTKGA
jgi:hypothetical protein